MIKTCHVALMMALVGLADPVHAFPVRWSLKEFQPNIPNGGRVNTIAVNPTNSNVVLVASETGGLFRSSDGGITWKHIDSFLPFAMGAVAYLPSNPSIVIATAGEGFLVNNAGGIWRSTDGGTTWAHIPDPATPPGFDPRFSAGEISIAPDTGTIFISTNYGLSISADNGVTWTTSQPFPGGGAASVLALPNNLVLAGAGWSVIRRSTDGGTTWSAATTAPVGVADMHAFGRSPFEPTHAYVVDQNTQLHVTEDGGMNWTPIASAPTGGGGCGGIGFVKAIRTSFPRGSLNVYFGNRCGLARLAPPRIAGTNRFNYSGAWTSLALDHGDTRDLVFRTNARLRFVSPYLLGTDGGLHRTSNGGLNWTFTGGGVNGYNALQITEVKGQWIDDIKRYDMYFGTQDNNNLASTDMGVTWPNAICCEGFFFEMQKHVATATDTQVTYVSCGPCGNLRSGPALGGTTGWANPAGAVAGNPAIVNRSFHVQGVNTDGGFTAGLAVTRNLGTTWTQYASFPEARADLPKLSHSRVLRFNLPVQYQSIRTGFDAATNLQINHLVRLTKRRASDTASVYYPAMTGFGGLGINPTMFAWYQVFGVDPTNSRFIIAPDIINEKMMQTSDGGENWTENTALTGLVTDSGRFHFRNSVFPHASAVSYYAGDPNMVAVGTHENGIMLSSDHGVTWDKVVDSERATYITSLEWRTATDVFVSTYGRGLWRLQGVLLIKEFPPLCRIVDCQVRWIDRGDPPFDRIDPGIVIFEGRAMGARVENGRVVELFVSPGSSVGVVGAYESASKVKVTESRRVIGLTGIVRGLSRWPTDGQVVALALNRTNSLRGLALAKRNLPTSEPLTAVDDTVRADEQESEQGPERSPTARKPYVSLTLPGSDIGKLVGGERFVATGQRFPANAALEVLIDRDVVEKPTVRNDGTFSVTLAAPSTLGVHTLAVRDARTRRVIDGVQFKVNRGEARKSGEPEQRGRKKDNEENEGAGERVPVRPPVRGR